MRHRDNRRLALATTLTLGAVVVMSRPDQPSAWPSTPPARGMGATAPDVVEPIVKRMKAAQSRLNEGDTGSQTRAIQEEVVRDLDKLIEAASQSDSSSRQSSSGGKSQRDSENGSPQQGQQAQRGGSQGASATAGGSAPGRRGGSRTPRPVPTKGAIGRQSTLVREVWGHLPPAVRERVRVDFSETVLPAYDELVRKYFEALLEEPSPRRGAPATDKALPPTR